MEPPAQPPRAIVAPARFVLQSEPLGTFIGLAQGERFALFATTVGASAVFDLAQQKVAWRIEGDVVATHAGKDHVAYVPSSPALGPPPSVLRIRRLISGEEHAFEGAVVENAQLPAHYVALREGATLGLLDAATRTWLLRATTKLPAQSAALSADGKRLYVLSQDRARDTFDRYEHALWLEIFRLEDFDAAAGKPIEPYARHAWEYHEREIREQSHFEGSSMRTSSPRVYRTDSGAVVIGHESGCIQCRMHAPPVHLWRAVDEQTAKPSGSWAAKYFSEIAQGSLEALAWQTATDQRPRIVGIPVPERVQRALAGRLDVEVGRFEGGCQNEACFFTRSAGRSCAWSLADASPIGCLRLAKAAPECLFPVQAVDSKNVFFSRCGYDSPLELVRWDARSGATELRRFEGTWTSVGHFPFVFAPRGMRFLNHVGARTEAWTWGRQAPDWVHAGCDWLPHFSDDGARVACPREEHADAKGRREITELDAATGKVLRTQKQRVEPRQQETPPPCGLRFVGRNDIHAGEEKVASVYAFDDGEWALVLPSGVHHASAGTRKHIAFFALDGALLDDRSVDALAQPAAVREKLAGFSRCGATP